MSATLERGAWSSGREYSISGWLCWTETTLVRRWSIDKKGTFYSPSVTGKHGVKYAISLIYPLIFNHNLLLIIAIKENMAKRCDII